MRKTHGLSEKLVEYFTREAMRQRCTNVNHPKYFRYGGRGITVCEQWNDFTVFYADMGHGPVLNTPLNARTTTAITALKTVAGQPVLNSNAIPVEFVKSHTKE